jgi:hypothetical protein
MPFNFVRHEFFSGCRDGSVSGSSSSGGGNSFGQNSLYVGLARAAMTRATSGSCCQKVCHESYVRQNRILIHPRLSNQSMFHYVLQVLKKSAISLPLKSPEKYSSAYYQTSQYLCTVNWPVVTSRFPIFHVTCSSKSNDVAFQAIVIQLRVKSQLN